MDLTNSEADQIFQRKAHKMMIRLPYECNREKQANADRRIDRILFGTALLPSSLSVFEPVWLLMVCQNRLHTRIYMESYSCSVDTPRWGHRVRQYHHQQVNQSDVP